MWFNVCLCFIMVSEQNWWIFLLLSSPPLSSLLIWLCSKLLTLKTPPSPLAWMTFNPFHHCLCALLAVFIDALQSQLPTMVIDSLLLSSWSFISIIIYRSSVLEPLSSMDHLPWSILDHQCHCCKFWLWHLILPFLLLRGGFVWTQIRTRLEP